ncbi:hypothetical protein AVEN_198311-1 [Araneus ventricosus]|uniref:Uncharacterized protein n=1 Tax=Araneus ventricosus TaxID=182803 RepID=A0A4Y2RJK1_ARAVE|nr:hypothetical protein AVEN_198311-1 [Araneus ventricosus]
MGGLECHWKGPHGSRARRAQKCTVLDLRAWRVCPVGRVRRPPGEAGRTGRAWPDLEVSQRRGRPSKFRLDFRSLLLHGLGLGMLRNLVTLPVALPLVNVPLSLGYDFWFFKTLIFSVLLAGCVVMIEEASSRT